MQKQKFINTKDLVFDFFFLPGTGKIGMGASLLNDITSKIMEALPTINNITPTEFADTNYPEFERIINAAFKLLFKDGPDISVFERAKKA